MVTAQIAIFIVVFAAIVIAYTFGARSKSGNYINVPRIAIWLEYRDENGRATGRNLTLTKTLVRNDGRSYLCGSDSGVRNFKMFRTDRIISIATLDGEVIDKHAFLQRYFRAA